jgi:hypothetical protein
MASAPRVPPHISVEAIADHIARVRSVISDTDLALLRTREAKVLNFHAAYGLSLLSNAPVSLDEAIALEMRELIVSSPFLCFSASLSLTNHLRRIS